MSDDYNPNRTVMRPSPLQARGGVAPDPAPPAAAAVSRRRDDDIPPPAHPPRVRNPLMAAATRVLALAASVRSGRASLDLTPLHTEAVVAITAFDATAEQAGYATDVRQRAKYALCATVDDIARNLPGVNERDASEWERQNLVGRFFRDDPGDVRNRLAQGGEMFWEFVDELIARPEGSPDLVELYHACIAVGFEGRLRRDPDGRRRIQERMTRLYGALEHVRRLSEVELVPNWRGAPTPPRQVGFWSIMALAAGVAAAVLLAIYIFLLLLLMQSGQGAEKALSDLQPKEPLRLSESRPAPVTPPSTQLQTLRHFLQPQIDAGQVIVQEDGQSVRVRTTIGELFKSGSDQLTDGKTALFEIIGKAVETQPGQVRIEGYTDSDQLRSPAFHDNMELSQARAATVAGIVKRQMTKPDRVTTQGYGETSPVADNATPEGKAQNRRVEIVVDRQS